MTKRNRQITKLKTTTDVTKLGEISKNEILEESSKYDMDNYDPLKHLSEKEMLIPKKRSEILTLRLTPQENKVITSLANENGLSKSSLIRMMLRKALKKQNYL